MQTAGKGHQAFAYAAYAAVVATGWISSSTGLRSPGLRFRRIVLVFSVGVVEDEGT